MENFTPKDTQKNHADLRVDKTTVVVQQDLCYRKEPIQFPNPAEELMKLYSKDSLSGKEQIRCARLAFQFMQYRVQDMGFKCIKVVRDSSSFFRCLAWYFDGTQEKHKKVRGIVADYGLSQELRY
jgi:hypothetical protein